MFVQLQWTNIYVDQLEGQVTQRTGLGFPAINSLAHTAFAIIVNVGFWHAAVGQLGPSATNRFGTSQAWQFLFTCSLHFARRRSR